MSDERREGRAGAEEGAGTGSAPARAGQKAAKARRFLVEVLTPAETLALIAAAEGENPGPADIRNAALIAVMYRAGLRVAEALGLQEKDIDLAAGTIRVLRAKGGRPRTVGIDGGGAAVLARWLTARASMPLSCSSAVFCSLVGKPLSTAYVRRLLPALARRAGLAKRVHAHGLRHTHAAELRAEGVDIAVISRQLGHRSLLTTIRYLDHLHPQAVIEAMSKRVWKA